MLWRGQVFQSQHHCKADFSLWKAHSNALERSSISVTTSLQGRFQFWKTHSNDLERASISVTVSLQGRFQFLESTF